MKSLPLNIVVPMAGLGSRFAKEGFALPKPLIDVAGVPMIKLVIGNVAPSRPSRFIFVCQQQHIREYDLVAKLRSWAPDCGIVTLDKVTDGAACTVLEAVNEINPEAPLMIVNSDQYIECKIDEYLAVMDDDDVDGLVMTMKAHDPKWSFVEFTAEGKVKRIVKKEVVSDEATVGIYNFRQAHHFINSAQAMIAADERVNGEFYVAPVYNRLIGSGYRVAIHNIGEEGKGMHGLGTPADLAKFLALPWSSAAVAETVR